MPFKSSAPEGASRYPSIRSLPVVSSLFILEDKRGFSNISFILVATRSSPNSSDVIHGKSLSPHTHNLLLAIKYINAKSYRISDSCINIVRLHMELVTSKALINKQI